MFLQPYAFSFGKENIISHDVADAPVVNGAPTVFSADRGHRGRWSPLRAGRAGRAGHERPGDDKAGAQEDPEPGRAGPAENSGQGCSPSCLSGIVVTLPNM